MNSISKFLSMAKITTTAITVISVSLFLQSQADDSKRLPEIQNDSPVQRLINSLPPCSILRNELQTGIHGSGTEQPYMTTMRQQGVQRALLELHAVLHGDQAKDIRVTQYLYFRQFDSPNSQISDEAVLNTIAASGLQRDLGSIARGRASAAPILKGPDVRFRPTKEISSFVEFFADAWLPEQKIVFFPAGRPKSLTESVVNGDASGTLALLRSHKLDKKTLDRALFDATLSRYDNTQVINLLLDAGADLNARSPEGATPLMTAVPHPCNLQSLLNSRADVNARDKWGRTALKLARDAKEAVSIRLLEEAGAEDVDSKGTKSLNTAPGSRFSTLTPSEIAEGMNAATHNAERLQSPHPAHVNTEGEGQQHPRYDQHPHA